MELGSNVLVSEEIKQTMGILPRNQARREVSQYFGQVGKPLKSTLNPGYIDGVKNAAYLCWKKRPKLLQEDPARLRPLVKSVSQKQPHISLSTSGIVTWIRRAPGAKAIRVSYQEGAILSDWIPME